MVAQLESPGVWLAQPPEGLGVGQNEEALVGGLQEDDHRCLKSDHSGENGSLDR